MPGKQKDNNSQVEPKEKPKIFQGIKTDRDDGIGGVAATMVWTRNQTPASVRQYFKEPRGLNFKKPEVGQQKKRGYVIPETQRESNQKELPFEGSVAGAMYGWGAKLPQSKEASRLENNGFPESRYPNSATTSDIGYAMMNSEDAETADYIAEKLLEKEQERTPSIEHGTQTTASLRHRTKPANRKPPQKKGKDKEGELWKMSKFTKKAKPAITTRHNKK